MQVIHSPVCKWAHHILGVQDDSDMVQIACMQPELCAAWRRLRRYGHSHQLSSSQQQSEEHVVSRASEAAESTCLCFPSCRVKRRLSYALPCEIGQD